MHEIGSLVIYGTNGVCRIEDLREECFTGEARSYYILRPAADTGNSKIFVPADNKDLLSAMKKPLSARALAQIIRKTPAMTTGEWGTDGRARSKRCKEILSSGDRAALISLIKTAKSCGYTPTAAEDAACLRAAAMLYEEFSLVFRLLPTDVIPIILGEIQPKCKE